MNILTICRTIDKDHKRGVATFSICANDKMIEIDEYFLKDENGNYYVDKTNSIIKSHHLSDLRKLNVELDEIYEALEKDLNK